MDVRAQHVLMEHHPSPLLCSVPDDHAGHGVRQHAAERYLPGMTTAYQILRDDAWAHALLAGGLQQLRNQGADASSGVVCRSSAAKPAAIEPRR